MSYASSYRLASERDAPSVFGRTSCPRVENTYQLMPHVHERFHPCYAEPIIAQVLQVRTKEISFVLRKSYHTSSLFTYYSAKIFLRNSFRSFIGFSRSSGFVHMYAYFTGLLLSLCSCGRSNMSVHFLSLAAFYLLTLQLYPISNMSVY